MRQSLIVFSACAIITHFHCSAMMTRFVPKKRYVCPTQQRHYNLKNSKDDEPLAYLRLKISEESLKKLQKAECYYHTYLRQLTLLLLENSEKQLAFAENPTNIIKSYIPKNIPSYYYEPIALELLRASASINQEFEKKHKQISPHWPIKTRLKLAFSYFIKENILEKHTKKCINKLKSEILAKDKSIDPSRIIWLTREGETLVSTTNIAKE